MYDSWEKNLLLWSHYVLGVCVHVHMLLKMLLLGSIQDLLNRFSRVGLHCLSDNVCTLLRIIIYKIMNIMVKLNLVLQKFVDLK